MSQEEIYNARDRSYSAWHRRMSTQRFVGIELAQTLAMIDLDASLYVEYDDGTKEPLALIETALDRGQAIKPATVTVNLARRCQPVVPAYVLLYTRAATQNPADRRHQDIAHFRVRRAWPHPEDDFTKMKPDEWAAFLVRLRRRTAHHVDDMLARSAAAAAGRHVNGNGTAPPFRHEPWDAEFWDVK